MALPYFPFYPDDWLPDVDHLDYAEQGVYFRLICQMWKAGNRTGDPTLPDDDAYIARLLRVAVDQWQAWRSILVDHPEGGVIHAKDGRLIQKRVAEEWIKACGKHQQATDAANARWERAKSRGNTGSNAGASTGGYAGASTGGYANGHAIPDAQTSDIRTPPTPPDGGAPETPSGPELPETPEPSESPEPPELPEVPEVPAPKKARGKRSQAETLPEDWKPSRELQAELCKEYPTVSNAAWKQCLTEFRLHYTASPVKNPNWANRWRTWVTKAWGFGELQRYTKNLEGGSRVASEPSPVWSGVRILQ